MNNLKQIIRLRVNGMALQTITKTIGIARNTVKKYLLLIESNDYDHVRLLSRNDLELEALLSDPDLSSDNSQGELMSFLTKHGIRTQKNRCKPVGPVGRIPPTIS